MLADVMEGGGVEPNPTKKSHNHGLFSFNSHSMCPAIIVVDLQLPCCLPYIIRENGGRQQENAPK